ncbi:hypothetical protein KAFR_0J00910 [Kazachstania africana CBS 2517]|uniref:Regulator of rDNA transcription 14 n=1 Tax=Kazachstania africana (strain ATCC 22294 / BCRC 22015 / CBS 2517 / CECT 1963 / NBRC 1671 / NRRL Y-8276) TaxID=1071382 RepID=H2B0K9_KAZAF|nr:hypothetical protein KAFR_0J00910 [Kazachstania africana CBS 2517]CCF60159.1 hypothetical protein KAFR_0J00910 [Kazachstania africana CBS 2517]
MSTFTNSSQLHATNAVNSLLSSLLPGARKINAKGKVRAHKGSKAQLIDYNLKKRVEIQERNLMKIKKNEKKIQKRKIQSKKNELKTLAQSAKLQNLEKHKLNGTLTKKEKKYLNALIEQNTSIAKSWELDQDNKDDLLEVQNFILKNSSSHKNRVRSNKRRSKLKEFKTELKDSSVISDHRYAGLTPGLAPVGLSDEEESSSEEEDDY